MHTIRLFSKIILRFLPFYLSVFSAKCFMAFCRKRANSDCELPNFHCRRPPNNDHQSHTNHQAQHKRKLVVLLNFVFPKICG